MKRISQRKQEYKRNYNEIQEHTKHTAQKNKFSIKRFFRITTKSAVLCGFGDIYWRNLSWKTFFN